MEFRGLEKYVGTYRVLACYDPITEDFPRDENGCIDDSFDDLYIPCTKGVIKHTYRDDYGLCWEIDRIKTGRSVRDQLLAKGLEIEFDETDLDMLIFFKEADLKKVAAIVKPKTNGKSIKPFSDKNLPKPAYEIPKKDLDKLMKLTENMEHQDKMLFTKKVVNDFDEVIQKKKGAKFNIAKERSASRLKPKVFIHSIGMWDDFVKFVAERV